MPRFEPRTIHFVLLGDEKTASSRIRGLHLISELRQRGHHVTSGSLWATERSPWVYGIGECPEILVLQKVFPPTAIINLFRRRASLLVLEIDDAVHLGYPNMSTRLATVLGHRVRHLASMSDVLTTPSPLLASEIALERRSLVFPGPAPKYRGSTAVGGLIWLGSPSTEPNLELLRGCGEMISGWRGGARAVGGGKLSENLGLTPVEWSPSAESEVLAMSTVGLMPLIRSEWNDRKASYKVLEYLAAGVAPIASASPALDALGSIAKFVYSVSEEKEWPRALEKHNFSEVDLDWRKVQVALDELSVARYADAWEETVLG